MKFVTIGALILAVAMAQDPPLPVPAPAPAPALLPVLANVVAPVIQVTQVAENTKLASKEWKNYKGCDDTCLSLCLENPTGYDSKCSVLFSNATIVKSPSSDNCRKASAIQDCTYQCSCACKRCSFCKQDLISSCEADKNPHDCLDHVLDQIILTAKCD